MTIKIVSCPMKRMIILYSYVQLPGGTSQYFILKKMQTLRNPLVSWVNPLRVAWFVFRSFVAPSCYVLDIGRCAELMHSQTPWCFGFACRNPQKSRGWPLGYPIHFRVTSRNRWIGGWFSQGYSQHQDSRLGAWKLTFHHSPQRFSGSNHV